tara:strand:- start:137 stop:295 length:159 start_codon:yes stop_codon:yes gene_type:complete
MNKKIDKTEFAQKVVDDMDMSAIYECAYDFVYNSIEKMTDSEFEEYLAIFNE